MYTYVCLYICIEMDYVVLYRDNGKENGSDSENATLLAALCHSFVVRW